MNTAKEQINFPVVEDYQEAREFLLDTLAWLKKTDSEFSRRNLSQVVGISPAYLSLMLSGQRPIKYRTFSKILGQLPLSEEQRRAADALFIVGKKKLKPTLSVVRGGAERPDVFTYGDCRFFIKDYFRFLKLTQGDLSLARLARKTQIHKTTLSKLFNGKKVPSELETQRLLKLFDFSSAERKHFQNIWKVGADSDPITRAEKFQDALKEARKSGKGISSLTANQYLSEWYYAAIRDLLGLRGQEESPRWIQAHLKFKVSLEEIRTAVKFLFDHGFLIQNSDGSVSVEELPLRAEGGIFRLTIRNYHRKILERAQEAIEGQPKEKRHFLSNTLSVAEEDLAQVMSILCEAHEKIGALGERPKSPNQVIQVNLNFFQLAELLRKKEEK